jgi:hypothetical protein
MDLPSAGSAIAVQECASYVYMWGCAGASTRRTSEPLFGKLLESARRDATPATRRTFAGPAASGSMTPLWAKGRATSGRPLRVNVPPTISFSCPEHGINAIALDFSCLLAYLPHPSPYEQYRPKERLTKMDQRAYVGPRKRRAGHSRKKEVGMSGWVRKIKIVKPKTSKPK